MKPLWTQIHNSFTTHTIFVCVFVINTFFNGDTVPISIVGGKMMKNYVTTSILFILLLVMITPIHGIATVSEELSNNEEDSNELNLASDAKSAVLMEKDTGTILFSKNSHERLPPASVTKLMTLLLIIEAIDNNQLSLDEMIRISENASSMGGSQLRSEEHTSELQSRFDLVCRVLLEKQH